MNKFYYYFLIKNIFNCLELVENYYVMQRTSTSTFLLFIRVFKFSQNKHIFLFKAGDSNYKLVTLHD
jgi:hypothetical protein